MTSMLGATASPCALFCMGMILAAQLRSTRGPRKGWLWSLLPIQIMKLGLMPLLTYACLRAFDVGGLPLAVAVLLSGMPTGVSAYVIAEKHQTGAPEASWGIIFSTSACVVTVPLTVWVLGELGLF